MNKNPNLSPQAAPMPVQSPAVRCRNFDEVALGYDKAAAMEEARRCLDCPGAPCRTGCPVRVRIPEFIAKVAEGDFDAAWEILSAENTLPAVCGRVCPQENQCQKTCVRGKKGESVAIGRLERFVADYHRTRPQTAPALSPKNGQKVAVVGSGPAGLACAGELAKRGYSVTVFEALHTPGGVLAYGIPAFRLPKRILAEEIAGLEALGVTIQTDAVVGRTIPVEELLQTGRIREVTPSDVWYEARTDFGESRVGTPNPSHPDGGFVLLQGAAHFSGKILGGCIDTLFDFFDGGRYADMPEVCQTYGLFPPAEDWAGKILLLESSEEYMPPEKYRQALRHFKAAGVFAAVSGVLVGKPMNGVYESEYFSALREEIADPALPVMCNVNIGHALPRCILPFGVEAHVDAEKQKITFAW